MSSWSWRTAGMTLVGIVMTLLPAALSAQDITFHGQVRPRFEFRSPAGDSDDSFTSMRVRAAIDAVVNDNLSLFIQIQDVRLFGEERNTLTDFRADNFDMHQAYLRYTGESLDWLTTTIGRQETNFGGQRLVGAVGWTQQGRSFDGLRLDLAADEDRVVSVVAYQLADKTASTQSEDQQFYGAYATLPSVGPGELDLFALYDRVDADGAFDTDQGTLGARYAFESGGVTGRVEGAFQVGDRDGEDVSAYMVGARVGTSLGDSGAGITLWYDYLSGDDDLSDGEAGTFSTLFATNHKFYGFADLFLNIPSDTGFGGLQDLAVKFSWTSEGGTRFGADLHTFRLAEQRSFSDSHLGEELDLTVSHRYSGNLTMTSGLSLVVQGDAWGEAGRLSEDMTWFYVMFDARF